MIKQILKTLLVLLLSGAIVGLLDMPPIKSLILLLVYVIFNEALNKVTKS